MDQTKRETWTKRVDRWNDSGLTADEFASEVGISSKSLRWWKWRLGSESRAAGKTNAPPKRTRKKNSPLTFVELAPQVVSAPIEIVLRSGIQVRVPTGFDVSTLERVLGVVERRA